MAGISAKVEERSRLDDAGILEFTTNLNSNNQSPCWGCNNRRIIRSGAFYNCTTPLEEVTTEEILFASTVTRATCRGYL